MTAGLLGRDPHPVDRDRAGDALDGGLLEADVAALEQGLDAVAVVGLLGHDDLAAMSERLDHPRREVDGLAEVVGPAARADRDRGSAMETDLQVVVGPGGLLEVLEPVEHLERRPDGRRPGR